jgi:hypothetical protein
MVLYGSSFINLIFGFRGLTAALAHVDPHCVAGIALPPVDATSLFHCSSGCMRENEEKKKIKASRGTWSAVAIVATKLRGLRPRTHVAEAQTAAGSFCHKRNARDIEVIKLHT